jgi:hypothetical protein
MPQDELLCKKSKDLVEDFLKYRYLKNGHNHAIFEDFSHASQASYLPIFELY